MKPSGHPTSWRPRPATSSRGGAPESPSVSYAIVSPFARACSMPIRGRGYPDGGGRARRPPPIRRLLQAVRLQELVGDLAGVLLVEYDGAVHPPHRLDGQLRADRVHGLREPGPELRQQARLHNRRGVLEAEHRLRVDQDRVLAALELSVRREHVGDVDLPLVE